MIRAMSRTKWILVALLVTPVLLFAIYLFMASSFAYSEGERAGILQKFSRKGWLCKTYEGELAMTTVPGVAPVLWAFSVSDDDVAEQLRAAVGQRVVLHYAEHRGLPTTCFGETSYFVDEVRITP
jgi:hypothetical protein